MQLAIDNSSNNTLSKILIVDSGDQIRSEAAQYLNDTGYRIFEATKEEAVFATITENKPECVLFNLDSMSEKMNDLLVSILQTETELPVIVLAEASQNKLIVEALRLGASDFLIKPVLDLEVLEYAIERSLERNKLRQENLEYRKQLEKANSDLKNNLAVLEQDQQAGLLVQMKMLPLNPMQKGAYVFTHQIVPSLYLSGDFIEYVTVGTDHVVFFVADVSGHGASSAFVTVMLKNLTARMRSDFNRLGSDDILHPAEFLTQANAELLGTGIGKHATLFYAVLDTRQNSLVYAAAGQLPLPILIVNSEASYIEAAGSPVGLFEEIDYVEHQMDLPETFRLIVFSDGILEVLDEPTLAAKEVHLLDAAATAKGDTEAVLRLFGVDSEQKYPDDVAALIVDKH